MQKRTKHLALPVSTISRSEFQPTLSETERFVQVLFRRHPYYKKDSFYLYTEGIEVNNSTKDDIEPVGNTDMAPVKNTTANKAAKTTKESSAKTDTKKSDNTVLFVIIAVAVIAAAAVITVAVSKKKKSAELNGENDKASSGEKNEDKNSTDGKEE